MTAGACQLREGTAADLPGVMAVMAGAFDPAYNEAWSLPQCQGMLGLAGTWLLVAEQAGTPCGFALGRTVGDESELLLLAVLPGFRRLRIGSRLVARAKALATAAGSQRLFLEMREGNQAQALYREQGFAPIGRRPAYYRFANGERCDAITFATTL